MTGLRFLQPNPHEHYQYTISGWQSSEDTLRYWHLNWTLAETAKIRELSLHNFQPTMTSQIPNMYIYIQFLLCPHIPIIKELVFAHFQKNNIKKI